MPAVDADSLFVAQSVTNRAAQGKITLTRRNVRRLPFPFYRGANQIELPEGSTGQALLKKKGEFASPSLARALTWTKEGTGDTAVYWFELSLLTDEMEGEFAVEGDAPEPSVISDLVLEINLIIGGLPQTPLKIPAEVLNRYLQEDEDETNPADPDMPPAADILVRTAQALSGEEKTQVQTNLGLASMLCRELIALPAGLNADLPNFATAGSAGQYTFDEARFRFWVYIAAQWRYSTLISAS